MGEKMDILCIKCDWHHTLSHLSHAKPKGSRPFAEKKRYTTREEE